MNILQIGKKYFPDCNIDKNFVEQLTVQMEKAESEDQIGRRVRFLSSDSHYSVSVKVKTQVDIIRPPGMRKIVIIELYQVILPVIAVTSY